MVRVPMRLGDQIVLDLQGGREVRVTYDDTPDHLLELDLGLPKGVLVECLDENLRPAPEVPAHPHIRHARRVIASMRQEAGLQAPTADG